jgi:hypothetical protein
VGLEGWSAGGGGLAQEVARAGRCDKALQSVSTAGGSGRRLGRCRRAIHRRWGRGRVWWSHQRGGGGGSSFASRIDCSLYSPTLFSLFRQTYDTRAVKKFTVCTDDVNYPCPLNTSILAIYNCRWREYYYFSHRVYTYGLSRHRSLLGLKR